MSDQKDPELTNLEVHRDQLAETVRQRKAQHAKAKGAHKAELKLSLDQEQGRLSAIEEQIKELSKPEETGDK